MALSTGNATERRIFVSIFVKVKLLKNSFVSLMLNLKVVTWFSPKGKIGENRQ